MDIPDDEPEDINYVFSDLEFSEDFEVREDLLNDLQQRVDQTPIDTRPPLSEFVPDGDQFQQKVIESSDRTIRMLASAGSGKTQTVLNRVLRQIQQGVRADRILLLTFDNAAASSLKGKLYQQLTVLNTTIDGLRIQTLNSYGYGFLRSHAPREYKHLIKQRRSSQLIREIKKALQETSPDRFELLPVKLANSFYIDLFSRFKNELFDPRVPNAQGIADFIQMSPHTKAVFIDGVDPINRRSVIQSVIWLYGAYELALKRDGVIDFDDQKLRTYTLLRDSPPLRQRIQAQFDEIIVDEFQDINRLDFALVQLLSERCRLLITGDDDQAIYGFRGCTPDFIIDLEKHIGRPVASYELRYNYRNPPNLLNHANTLIAHNTHRVPKDPIAACSGSCEITLLSSVSAGLEAKLICSFVERIRESNKALDYHDFAILYRTNAQSLLFQVEFILSNTPYYVRPEDNILENETLQRLLGFLRLKLQLAARRRPAASDAVLSIESYFRFIDNETRHRLTALFSASADFLMTVASEEFFTILPKARTSNLVPAIVEALNSINLIDTLNVLANRFNGLRGMIGSLEDAIQERVPLGEIFELALNFSGDTKDFLETMDRALAQAHQTGAGKARENGVMLLTYFKAKGLQWHTVILASCNEGLIPHGKAFIEDERRLFYVAMTRAESNLLISFVKKSCNNKVVLSRFVAEAGLVIT